MGKKPEKVIKGNESLAKTLSRRSGITVFICLLVVGVVLLCMVAGSVKTLLDTSFTQLTATNASKIREKIYSSERDNELIADYVSSHYNEIIAKSQESGVASTIIAGETLTAGVKELEDYLLKYLPMTIKNNSMVEGVGIFFEPYAADLNVEKYGFYVCKKAGSETDTEAIYPDIAWTREYYKQTVESGKKFVSSPYSDYLGHNVVTITNPIIVNGKAVGIMMSDLRIDELANIDFEHGNNKTFLVALVNQNDEIMFHSKDKEAIGKPAMDRIADENAKADIEKHRKTKENFRVSALSSNKTKFEVFFSPIEVDEQQWWVYSAVERSDFYANMNKVMVVTVLLLLASVVILIIMMLIQITRSLKPLEELVVAGEALQNGNLGYKIQYSGDDEIGRVCNAIQEAFLNLERVIGEISTAMKGLSQGDLTYMPKQTYVGDFEEIKESYMRLLEGLNAGFRKIKISATQISDGADQVSQGAQSLSQSSTEQAASLQELSATIGDIAGKINLNAQSADEANELSNQIGDAIKVSNEHMNNLMNAMEKMTEASSEVNKIIKTIDDIAFQTNILALNAAVEAARAGEAGKGFAVVADEVRNLASKSAVAAKSTTELIETSINAVADGKGIAEKTAESLELVVQNANIITVKIKEILSSSEEQAVSASQINLGADQISSAVQTNSATSEQSAAASEELASQANILDTLIAQYKMLDDDVSALKKEDEPVAKPAVKPLENKEVKPAVKSLDKKDEKQIKTEIKSLEKKEAKPAVKSLDKKDEKQIKTEIKSLEKKEAKPAVKSLDKKDEKQIKTIDKPVETKDIKSVAKPFTKSEPLSVETEKTAEILAYESKAYDISQVKELHNDIPAPVREADEPKIKTNMSHTEISDFDNKYV
ncbi:MAG: methyl-accepting chemotaxis protein [Eubacteriales bacterium]